MGRAPCCDKNMGLKKGPWTPEEDQILMAFIHQHGHSNWRALPKQSGLLRCGKSCRLRWMNYLRPDIKRGNFTKEEEDTIINLHEQLGNRWSAIAGRLPGRTDNEIKNVWHTHLKKKLKCYEPLNPKSSNKKNSNKSKSKSESNNTRSIESSEPENSNASGVQSSPCNASYSSSSISDDISSTIITNSEGDNSKMISEDLSYSFENFDAEIDEGFWNEALYGDDHIGDFGIATTNREMNAPDVVGQEFHFGLVDDDMFLDRYCGDNVQNIDEFWYDLFVLTNGEQ